MSWSIRYLSRVLQYEQTEHAKSDRGSGEKAVRIKNPRYDLSVSQMFELVQKGGADAVCDVFNFGYMQGLKAARADLKSAYKA